MKISAISLALLATFSIFCSRGFSADEGSGPVDRNALAKKAKEDRLAYAASPEYNPYESESREAIKSTAELIQKKKYARAIALAKQGLSHSKYDIDLLMLLSTAYRESGDIPNAEKARTQWMSLVDSILDSGNGREFDSAFQVISVAEEYAVLRVLGLETQKQSLESHGGSSFDVMQVKDLRSGKEFTFYFNIDRPEKWLEAQFSGTRKSSKSRP